MPVAKDKKDNKKDKDKNKKHAKKGNGATLAKAPKKAGKSLQAVVQNPLVADVVAAALVSMAAALKDSDKARRLASDAGEQLDALSKKTAKEGSAMWDLALNIGRSTLDALASEGSARPKGKTPK